MMYLIDTNICSYLMKGTYPSLSEKILSIHPSQVAVSSITVLELEYGANKKGWGPILRQRMWELLSPFTVIPFEAGDAIVAGRIRAELARRGEIIGGYDVMIAAQGIHRGMTVVTHNTGEFIRVPGIKLEDWVEE